MTADRSLTVGLAVPPWPPIDGVLRSLDAAVELGLEVWSTWDHLAEFSAPAAPGGAGSPGPAPYEYQVLLGALAGRAGQVRLAVGVTELLRRHPVVVAQAFVTLAHLASRPPILGVGAGERINTEAYGVGSGAPVSVLEEGLHILRDCIDGRTPLTSDGDRFRVAGASFDLRSPSGREPEIWIGGRRPRLRRLTGRFGDGWYPTDIVDQAAYAAGVADVRGCATAAGRDPDRITMAGELAVFAVDDAADVPRVLASDEARMIGLLVGADAWREGGFEHPAGEGSRGFVDHERAGTTHQMLEAVPRELVARHVLAGTYSGIADQLAALHAVGMSHVNLSFGPLDDGSLRALRGIVGAVHSRTGGMS
jgi:phthiodiolone/phenolphthiodiolone dimycocerosates ketoreductase